MRIGRRVGNTLTFENDLSALSADFDRPHWRADLVGGSEPEQHRGVQSVKVGNDGGYDQEQEND